VTPRLHVVTDDAVLARADVLSRARDVLEAGESVALHLRSPHGSGRHVSQLASALLGVARASGATLLVNDRVDVALCLGLDGAHLGARSLAPGEARALLGVDRLLGASVHSVEEAVEAERGGVDYLIVGAIWATASHPERAPAGPELLREVAGAVPVPLLAIGGVTPERVPAVVEAGGHGVAVLRGIWDAPSSADAVRDYLQALEL
jgi:thiamine-phosphate diphosphorylase